MFNNVGRKIQSLALVWFIIEAIGCVIGGIAMMAADDDLILPAIAVILGGIFASWLSVLFLYGFGLIVENNELGIRQKTTASAQQAGATQPMQAGTAPDRGQNTVRVNANVFEFNCPHCHNKLSFERNNLLDTITCPYCGSELEIKKR